MSSLKAAPSKFPNQNWPSLCTCGELMNVNIITGVSSGHDLVCTFEDSLCGFKNDQDSAIAWNVKRPLYRGTNDTTHDDVRGK